VALDVEVRIVDPDRVANTERHLGKLLPIARRAAEPVFDVRTELFETRSSVVIGRPEERCPPDVHVRSGAFDLEERSVERG
jgi:hypothetical protein